MALDLEEMYGQLSDALKSIDEKLDSRDGGTTGVKSKIVNEKIAETEPNWTQVLDQITTQLATVPADIQVGFYFGLVRGLDKTYGDSAKKLIDELVNNAPKPEPLISEAEVGPLTEQRKEVYAKIKSVMSMAETFGDDSFAKMENPRRRGGAPKGKRGPRLLSFVEWNIDGTDYESLKDVVDAVPQYDKVRELTAALKAAKIDTTNPPSRIEFTLPDGRTLVGTYTPEVEDEDPDSEEATTEEE